MGIAKWAVGLALASSLGVAAPAYAQGPAKPITASNVSFFDEVQLGDLSLSPVNIFHDTRCADPEFCFRNNQFAISVILFTDAGLQEVILRLFEETPVPNGVRGGGTLTLTNTGTPPSQNGAIGLDQYRLEIVYRPTGAEAQRENTSESEPATQRALPSQIEPARA